MCWKETSGRYYRLPAASLAVVYPEILEVSLNPNYCAMADAMFEVMDQLGEVEGVK